MAEFKLGRIRFIWKGDWVTATTYYKDDIVRYGGNTYICIKGHTAPAEPRRSNCKVGRIQPIKLDAKTRL